MSGTHSAGWIPQWATVAMPRFVPHSTGIGYKRVTLANQPTVHVVNNSRFCYVGNFHTNSAINFGVENPVIGIAWYHTCVGVVIGVGVGVGVVVGVVVGVSEDHPNRI